MALISVPITLPPYHTFFHYHYPPRFLCENMYPTANIVPRLWRPNLPDSIDGNPLARTVEDLFVHFDYDRLPSNPYIAIWLRPEFTLVVLLFYVVVSKPLTAWIRDTMRLDPKGTGLRNFIAGHNLLLAVFSFVTAWNAWGIVVLHYLEHGVFASYCDPEGKHWDAGLGAWSFIFYISKYYEFVDTWILILKGKKASFLQVYHHTGIAFIMWEGVCSQSAWLQVVTLLNSVIHTLMYIYFFTKTLYPKFEIKAAKYLTRAQITQFFTGIIVSSGVLFMGESCDTQSSRFSLACLHVYGYGLIALFMAFAKRKYKSK